MYCATRQVKRARVCVRTYVCIYTRVAECIRAGYLCRPVTGERGGREGGGTWPEWATCCISAGNGSIIYCERGSRCACLREERRDWVFSGRAALKINSPSCRIPCRQHFNPSESYVSLTRSLPLFSSFSLSPLPVPLPDRVAAVSYNVSRNPFALIKYDVSAR